MQRSTKAAASRARRRHASAALVATLLVAAAVAGCSSPAPRATATNRGRFSAAGHYVRPLRGDSSIGVVLWIGNRATTLAPEAVKRVAQMGLHADWYPGDPWMVVRGRATLMARTFATHIGVFRADDGSTFVDSAPAPSVPRTLRGLVSDVGDLGSRNMLQPLNIPASGVSPTDVAKAYDIAPLQRLDLPATKVAFLEADGYSQHDFDTYTDRFPEVGPIDIDDATDNSADLKVGGEAEGDVEVVHGIAPHAPLSYYAPSGDDWASLTSALRQLVNDNADGVVSVSLGYCEQALASADIKAMDSVLQLASTMHETVLVSSGDNGAYECLRVDRSQVPNNSMLTVPYPASSQYVTSVGGTRLALRTDSSYYNETAWEAPPETGGTGGGTSCLFGRPDYQGAVSVPDRPSCSHGRAVPDVAADADPTSGLATYIDGHWQEFGGTSQAAPIWAGIMALVDGYLLAHGGHAAGFMNPALYTLADQSAGRTAFHDITAGSNLYDDARPGYDLATGLGSPDAWNLARALLAMQGHSS